MKSRFTPLVKIKKSAMQRSEQFMQRANVNLYSASTALELSYGSLKNVDSPQKGSMSEMLASRALLASQREVINHNKEWVAFAKNQVIQAKTQLKTDMIEYEKFQYLELQEIKAELKKISVKEAKDLDEIALITYTGKKR
ncbi:MAG TPA: flagellar export protein FliJ [Sulfurimonas sp.]|uniref:flagellar export protein FliJ n=1 Tax=Sulfurimonas sp. TaxID=2022749 RepID=UPI002D06EDC8|nr:flagellar export protein FliJ [Sulfurimonas sp.]HUH43083.1 flagellar export protein FliJ [Sulfurimonas sp.]